MKKLILTIIILAACLLAVSCEQDTPVKDRLHVGEQLPQFSTNTIEGRNVSTLDLLGKPSVIMFFSTTCPDCHRQLPQIQSAFDRTSDIAAFLAIARDEKEDKVRVFWNEAGYTMPVAAPGDRTIYDLFDRGSQSGVPQVYVSDAKGMIVLTADDSAVLSMDDIVRILTENKD